MKEMNKEVFIKPPNIKTVTFGIKGTAPLVVHRFSKKVKDSLRDNMEKGSTVKTKKKREPANFDELYDEAKYVSNDGWEGFNASSIRCALISACRLVGFKMTLAKLSLFVIPDGWDKKEPEIPLIKIYGKSRKLEGIARVETGQPYICVRACYDKWDASIKIRFDADQFTLDDVGNLLMRVGTQVGICEGRPDSKNSAGMGWGTFELVTKEELK